MTERETEVLVENVDDNSGRYGDSSKAGKSGGTSGTESKESSRLSSFKEPKRKNTVGIDDNLPVADQPKAKLLVRVSTNKFKKVRLAQTLELAPLNVKKQDSQNSQTVDSNQAACSSEKTSQNSNQFGIKLDGTIKKENNSSNQSHNIQTDQPSKPSTIVESNPNNDELPDEPRLNYPPQFKKNQSLEAEDDDQLDEHDKSRTFETDSFDDTYSTGGTKTKGTKTGGKTGDNQ